MLILTLKFRNNFMSTVSNQPQSNRTDLSINRMINQISHQCIDSKVIHTKLDQTLRINNSRIEQRCVHQSHSKCSTNKSNSSEMRKFCNSLTIGQKDEISTSFKALVSNQCYHRPPLSDLNQTFPTGTRKNDVIHGQKCIHQMHPECLDLSNLNEACLVCNALTVGRKYEISTSYQALVIEQYKQSTQRSLLNELSKLTKIGWYWGKLNRFEAEDKLINTPSGTFLIRDSFDNNYILSLSFRISEGVFHTRIEFRSGHFYFYLHPRKRYETVFALVDDLIVSSQTGIHYYVRSRKTGKEIRFLIKLDKPLSRLSEVKSLRYLCRFTIKQHIRYDLIRNLSIPDSIKSYLEENHF